MSNPITKKPLTNDQEMALLLLAAMGSGALILLVLVLMPYILK